MAKPKPKKTVLSKSSKKVASKVKRGAKVVAKVAAKAPKAVAKPAAKPPVKLAHKAARSAPITPPRPARIELKAKVTSKVVKESSKESLKNSKNSKNLKNSPPVIERGQPVPTAVPTNIKPRKNLAGLSPKELEYFRSLLLAKRRELVGDMSSMEHEALHSTSGSNLSNLPVHMADMGTDNYEQEFTLGLVEKDRVLLREINSALAKIQDGTYGLCEGTQKPISKARLEAKPWARHGIEYARKLEGGFGR